jgi:hypothetical protein
MMSDEYPVKAFIDLQGASGACYRFRLWPDGASHPPIAGNYVCVRAQGGDVEILSVGETLDLSELRKGLPRKVREATTHVYTRLNVARATRCAEHEDLKARHDRSRTRAAVA